MKHTLLADFAAISDHIAITKDIFEDYIKDTEIPLDERWGLFVKSPDYIKNIETYVQNFDWEQKHKAIEWYEDFGQGRYAHVGMLQIVEWMREQPENYNEEMIVDMKEEILSKNLGAFVYDW